MNRGQQSGAIVLSGDAENSRFEAQFEGMCGGGSIRVAIHKAAIFSFPKYITDRAIKNSTCHGDGLWRSKLSV